MAVIHYPGAEGPRRLVLGERTSIGRSPECDLVINDSSISRRHANISRVDGRFIITDEGSRFGSFVNRAQVQEATLHAGDEVRLGNVVLRFEEESGQVSLADAPPELTPSGPRPGWLETVQRVKMAELEERNAQLTANQRRSQALLALHESFLKCTSVGMIFQSVGPDVVHNLRADRCVIVVREGDQLVTRFQHQLPGLPAGRVAKVAAALASDAILELPAGSDARAALVAPLQGRGTTAHGAIYAELPPGRLPTRDELELLKAMSGLIGSAVANLSLLQQVRKEEQARANLSRYVSDQVAEALLKGNIDLNLGGARRLLTVVFVDVRGFTTLSEKLQPEHVLQMLNEYFGVAVPIVKGSLGTVDKFIGDALMAVFGAPNELPDHALRAVKAAVEIQKAVQRLREGWADRPWSQALDVRGFSVGIGVNTGWAVAGNLGTDERKEYAVIGDAVNVASRLCGNAAPNQILLGPETAEAARALYRLEALEPLKVKGRQQAVQSYRVV